MANYRVNWTPPPLHQMVLIKTGQGLIAALLPRIFGKNIHSYMESRVFTMEVLSTLPATEISSLVVTFIHQLILPLQVKEDVAFVTDLMVDTLIKWLKMIIKKSKVVLPVDSFLNHICWTNFGAINTAETIRSWYLSGQFQDEDLVFNVLCHYCLEDCIVDYWSKSVDSQNRQRYLTELSTDISEVHCNTVPLYWWHRLHDKMDRYPIYLKNIPHCTDFTKNPYIEENMFVFSVCKFNYWATKYFWQLLDNDSKVRALTTVYNSNIHIQILHNFEVPIDLVMFIWTQLCNYRLCNYLGYILKQDHVRRKIADWPWRDIFIRTLEKAMSDFDPSNCEDVTIATIIAGNYFGDDMYSECKELFFSFWKKCPHDVKITLNYEKIFSSLYAHGHIEMFDLLINDVTLRKEEREIILEELGKELSYHPNSDRSIMLYENIHCTEGERKRMKEVLSF